MGEAFNRRLEELVRTHQELLVLPNRIRSGTRLTDRVRDHGSPLEFYENPVVTPGHVPLSWGYDLNEETNPHLLNRDPTGATFNAGAIILPQDEATGTVTLAVRVENYHRKSFFGIAKSRTGTDNFRFLDKPARIPETDNPATNMYDMRLTQHEDGWTYGLFCVERKDPTAELGDLSKAIAQCGIVRTKDPNLLEWERLPDLKSNSAQQRNVVLHSRFIDGKYLLYTRPQDSFIEAGKGAGICYALCDSMEHAVIGDEFTIDPRAYHTIKEVKNGQGPSPILTPEGWLHIAHGVRGTASGLRYVLYAFLTNLERPWEVTHNPGVMLMGPEDWYGQGHVRNVTFTNGAVAEKKGRILLYYGTDDTELRVATTTVEKMLDYVKNTTPDPLRSSVAVENIRARVERNAPFLKM